MGVCKFRYVEEGGQRIPLCVLYLPMTQHEQQIIECDWLVSNVSEEVCVSLNPLWLLGVIRDDRQELIGGWECWLEGDQTGGKVGTKSKL